MVWSQLEDGGGSVSKGLVTQVLKDHFLPDLDGLESNGRKVRCIGLESFPELLRVEYIPNYMAANLPSSNVPARNYHRVPLEYHPAAKNDRILNYQGLPSARSLKAPGNVHSPSFQQAPSPRGLVGQSPDARKIKLQNHHPFSSSGLIGSRSNSEVDRFQNYQRPPSSPGSIRRLPDLRKDPFQNYQRVPSARDSMRLNTDGGDFQFQRPASLSELTEHRPPSENDRVHNYLRSQSAQGSAGSRSKSPSNSNSQWWDRRSQQVAQNKPQVSWDQRQLHGEPHQFNPRQRVF